MLPKRSQDLDRTPPSRSLETRPLTLTPPMTRSNATHLHSLKNTHLHFFQPSAQLYRFFANTWRSHTSTSQTPTKASNRMLYFLWLCVRPTLQYSFVRKTNNVMLCNLPPYCLLDKLSLIYLPPRRHHHITPGPHCTQSPLSTRHHQPAYFS